VFARVVPAQVALATDVKLPYANTLHGPTTISMNRSPSNIIPNRGTGSAQVGSASGQQMGETNTIASPTVSATQPSVVSQSRQIGFAHDPDAEKIRRLLPTLIAALKGGPSNLLDTKMDDQSHGAVTTYKSKLRLYENESFVHFSNGSWEYFGSADRVSPDDQARYVQELEKLINDVAGSGTWTTNPAYPMNVGTLMVGGFTFMIGKTGDQFSVSIFQFDVVGPGQVRP
jgi:hypothetical protein